MRLDDAIGPTFASFPGHLWANIRGFHPFFTGWGAGYYLGRGQDVLIEGHLKTPEERARLLAAIKQVCHQPFEFTVLCLTEERETIIRRREADTDWEPDLPPADRASAARGWGPEEAPSTEVYDVEVEARGRPPEEVAQAILDALHITDLRRPLRAPTP
jgi:hypothetical protein